MRLSTYIGNLSRLFSGMVKGAAAVALILALSAPVYAEVVDRIVAVINDSIITLSELNAATAIKLDELKKKGSAKVDRDILRKEVLDDLLRQRLVKQASDNAGIDVSEREIDNAIEDIKKQNGNMTEKELLYALERSGLTYREYREQLKEQIRQVKFIDIAFRSKISVQPEDIESYYRQNIENFYEPPKYRISVILLSSRDAELLEKRLAVVLDGLKKGEDFAGLVKSYSDGPNTAEGGDLGYLARGELNKALENTALGLKPGEWGGPVERPEGTYIIKLTEPLKSEPIPLDEVRGFIHEKLYKKIMEDRFDFWLQEQKKYAHIEIRL